MTNLGSILGRLGLGQYHDALVEEGFDTWDTVLDIQESDLIALDFKLGHRRKLQREIANYRGVSYDHSIGSPALDTVSETGRATESLSTPTDTPEIGIHRGSETKRKYRRHPKPDENAPSRAPSAYVIFSNKIREDVRGQNMSFTDIAKLVGDRWQKLALADKEPYETQATRAKEKYNAELAEYKRTDSYRDYMRYLVEFKAKHGGSATENKRPRLENESSNGSLSAKSTDALDTSTVSMRHIRVGSMGTAGSTMSQGELGSPISLAANSGPANARLPPISPSPDVLALLPPYEQRPYMAFSSQSSVSDESTTVRDLPDPLPHAAQLSLLPGPGRLTEKPQSPTTAEFMRMPTTNRRPVLTGTPLGAPPSGSDSNSRSSASSRSNVNSSEGSFMFLNSNSSMDETWPGQPADTAPPPFSQSMSIPLTTAPLPRQIATERLPDVLQDPAQRILPLPTTSAPPDSYQSLRSLPRISTITAAPPRQDFPVFGLSARMSAEQKSPLDRSESEAADALAGLAYGSRPRLPGGPGGSKRPP